MENSVLIKEPMLRELIRSLISVETTIQGTKQGFLISVRIGEQERTLETARGATRLFASLDTAASFIRDIGLPRFVVDMTEYEPGRLRRARPDRSEALKQTRTRMKQQSLGI